MTEWYNRPDDGASAAKIEKAMSEERPGNRIPEQRRAARKGGPSFTIDMTTHLERTGEPR